MFLKILGSFKIAGINDVIFTVHFDTNFQIKILQFNLIKCPQHFK